MQIGAVAVAYEDLRICRNQGFIQVGENPNLIVAADCRDDRSDRGIGVGRVDIVCARLWVLGEIFGLWRAEGNSIGSR